MLGKLQGRNGTGEFARRSMKNLDFVLTNAETGADVHPVTQTVGSLLGIIVFPWERSALFAVKKKRLAVAATEGWPSWQMTGTLVDANKVKNVGQLIKLVRNSVAHGKVTFDSDSKHLTEVTVTFENYPRGSSKMNWRGVIRADHLASFCRKFSEYVADHVG
jgi:HEPN pEK499 p136